MGLVQKIFYFHVPSWMAMYAAIASAASPARSICSRAARAPIASRSRPRELAVLFGLIGLVTGPLWGRKAWGVWWQWDARLTMALLLELIFIGYLLVRKYGGPGSEKLAAAMAHLRLAQRAVRLHVGRTSGARSIRRRASCRRCRPGMRGPFWFCVARVHAAVRRCC